MIRHASESDFQEIVSIRSPYILDIARISDPSYRWKMQKSGFIGSFTHVEFERDLHHMFLVEEDETGITGYLRVDRDHEYKDNEQKTWLIPGSKESYFHGHHAEVGMIGVREDKKEKGIATALLHEAMKMLQEKDILHLFSIVVISPLTNFPSMMFHEKRGFQRVAISNPHEHFEISQYQSMLYRIPLK